MLNHGLSLPLYYQLSLQVSMFLDPRKNTFNVYLLHQLCNNPSTSSLPFSHLTHSCKQQVTSILPTVNSSFTKGNPGPAAWTHVLSPTAWGMQLPLLPAYNLHPQTPETVTHFLVHQLPGEGGSASLTWKTLLQRQRTTLGFP